MSSYRSVEFKQGILLFKTSNSEVTPDTDMGMLASSQSFAAELLFAA